DSPDSTVAYSLIRVVVAWMHQAPCFPDADFPLFLQAKDGRRDRNVTGVQTCALPISLPATIRLPDCTRAARAVNTALIPVAVAKQASAPSIRRMRSSKAETVGLP